MVLVVENGGGYIAPEPIKLEPIELEKEIPPELLEALQKFTAPKLVPFVDLLTDIKVKTVSEEYILDVIEELEEHEGETYTEWEKFLLKLKLQGFALKAYWNKFKDIGTPLIIGVGAVISLLVGYQFSKSYIAEKGAKKARG